MKIGRKRQKRWKKAFREEMLEQERDMATYIEKADGAERQPQDKNWGSVASDVGHKP